MSECQLMCPFNLEKAARELVAPQDDNPMLDMDTLPFGTSYEAARASHAGPES